MVVICSIIAKFIEDYTRISYWAINVSYTCGLGNRCYIEATEIIPIYRTRPPTSLFQAVNIPFLAYLCISLCSFRCSAHLNIFSGKLVMTSVKRMCIIL
jgi:hypothetical protein